MNYFIRIQFNKVDEIIRLYSSIGYSVVIILKPLYR
jgi:hypothetical protein